MKEGNVSAAEKMSFRGKSGRGEIVAYRGGEGKNAIEDGGEETSVRNERGRSG